MRRLRPFLAALLLAAAPAGSCRQAFAQVIAPSVLSAAPLGFAPAAPAWGDTFSEFSRWLDTPDGSATLGRSPLFPALQSLDFRSEDVRAALTPLVAGLPEGFSERMRALRKDGQREADPQEKAVYGRVLRDAYGGFGERVLMAARQAAPEMEAKLTQALAQARDGGAGSRELGGLARQAQVLALFAGAAEPGGRISALAAEIRSARTQAVFRETGRSLDLEGAAALGEVERGSDGRWPALRVESGGHAYPLVAAARHIEAAGVPCSAGRLRVSEGPRPGAGRSLQRGPGGAITIHPRALSALKAQAGPQGLSLHDKLVHALLESELAALSFTQREIRAAGLGLERALSAGQAINIFRKNWLKKFAGAQPR